MKKLTIAIICLCLAIPAPAQTIIVDDNAPADFNNIQAAIDNANNADTIILQPGTYTGPGNRNIDFHGKAITLRSTDPDDPTIVNATVIDCQYAARAFNFHTAEQLDTVIAGLTITKGRINAPNAKAGAIYCSAASPLIQKCIITGNSAHAAIDTQARGGAIYLESNSAPIFENCTITNNSAIAGNGHSDTTGHAGPGSPAYAGAIYCAAGSSAAIIDSKLLDNIAQAGNAGYSQLWRASGGDAHAGAIYIQRGAHLTIANSIIRNNVAAAGKGKGGDVGYDGNARGGAIACAEQASINIHNCILANNHALGGTRACRQYVSGRVCKGGKAYGGAIDLRFQAAAQITSSTIAANSTSTHTGATCGSAIACADLADVTLENSILWANTGAPQLNGDPTTAYSNIQDGSPGNANINTDPRFVRPGRYDTNNTPNDPTDDFWIEGDYHLRPDSPCINAGDPEFPQNPPKTDIDGQPRIIAARIDIGADEADPKQADLNKDGIVNLKDFAALSKSFNSTPNNPNWNPLCDLKKDNKIKLCDLAALTNNWLWKAP